MEIIKKIAIVIGIIVSSLIRLPITLLGAVVNWTDFGLVKLNVKLTKELDCDWWTDAVYWAQDRNVNGFMAISEMFEELQEDLA